MVFNTNSYGYYPVMKNFTIEELKQYDGREGRKAYIACEGLVYDVTGSFLWKDGRHQASHRAGQDLSDALVNAPHGIEFVKRFTVVGYIIKKDRTI